MKKIILLVMLCVLITSVYGTSYYFSTSGSDANDALTTSTPKKTVYAAMNLNSVYNMSGGDQILFKCGDRWDLANDSIFFPSYNGSSTAGNIIFSSYGDCLTKNKPLFTGANRSCSSGDWTEIDTNVWNYTKSSLPLDVGSIWWQIGGTGIYDNAYSIPRNWSITDLKNGATYLWYYNRTSDNLFLWSIGNPVLFYGCLDITFDLDLLYYYTGKFYTFNNLSFGYTGGNCINVNAPTAGLQLTYLDVFRCGGAYFGSPTSKTRYGNGIQLWRNVANVTIAHNRVDSVYDSAITPQGTSTSTFRNVSNITMEFNTVSNSCIGLEYWEYSNYTYLTYTNVNFKHNTLVGIGSGWYYKERNLESGQTTKCVFMRGSTSYNETHLNISDNLFYNTNEFAYSLPSSYNNLSGNVRINYNAYVMNDSRVFNHFAYYYPLNTSYNVSYSEWVAYTGYDNNSLYNPAITFVDVSNRDYTMYYNFSTAVCTGASDGGAMGAYNCIYYMSYSSSSSVNSSEIMSRIIKPYSELADLWPLLVIVIVLLVVIGFVMYWENGRSIEGTTSSLKAFIIGLILSAIIFGVGLVILSKLGGG